MVADSVASTAAVSTSLAHFAHAGEWHDLTPAPRGGCNDDVPPLERIDKHHLVDGPRPRSFGTAVASALCRAGSVSLDTLHLRI